MHDHSPAIVPGREQDAAMAAFVLDVLEGANEVWDASKAETATNDGGPGTVREDIAVSFRTRL